MRFFWKELLTSAILLLSIDFIYLQWIQKMFLGQIQSVQGSGPVSFDFLAIVLCYIALIYGLNYFILSDPRKTFLDAFWLGIVVYAVYETTNKALLRSWKWSTVLIDTLWGGVLFALVTFIHRRIFLS